jgi:non-heme chloroperoxidase
MKIAASGEPVDLIHRYPLSGASGHHLRPQKFGKSSQPTTGYNDDTFAEDLHKLITHPSLCDFTLVGFSMGGGEIARHFGEYDSHGASKAVIIGGVPPFLLKADDNPEGVDARVFEGIQKAVAADR